MVCAKARITAGRVALVLPKFWMLKVAKKSPPLHDVADISPLPREDFEADFRRMRTPRAAVNNWHSAHVPTKSTRRIAIPCKGNGAAVFQDRLQKGCSKSSSLSQ